MKLRGAGTIEETECCQAHAAQDIPHGDDNTMNKQHVKEPDIHSDRNLFLEESIIISISYGSVLNVSNSAVHHADHSIAHPNQHSTFSSILPSHTPMDMSFKIDCTNQPSSASSPHQRIGIEPERAQATVISSLKPTLPLQWSRSGIPEDNGNNVHNSYTLPGDHSIGFTSSMGITNIRECEIYSNTSIQVLTSI
ncbi:hypothetical protein PM082_023710 [Marasmius tenuissimus]|nr:hypothetical protein PM082_023703 [Marasmius tenuissimus]KAJ8092457.1 hypothetical protein PM082_023710 [Marasmius tenuissimus]